MGGSSLETTPDLRSTWFVNDESALAWVYKHVSSATFKSVAQSCRMSVRRWLFSFFPVLLGLFTVGVLAQDLVLVPPSSRASTHSTCANPPMDQCAFYANCLESRYQCGPDGYAIGYGQHYCQKFSDNRGMFDAQGQQWMISTMHCLQLALVGDAIDATPPASDCQALRDQAFASHAGCYISNGFCTLGVQVWTAVLEIVDIKTLFSSWGAFKSMIQTAGECAELYAYVVEKELF
ncbi:hypothetical protein L210DRAFT_2899200 [Boletus edulis BED1]|uniref:Uncharacterized protein n=1 Tax=Boletus edulis BED1 TaxID=1328754 RepID=A0AAD4BIT0_BOLED|nr:hypothetical protein L210DRAFT_2899200 [Boletus edulis BED1]